jgi:hypothetical protein
MLSKLSTIFLVLALTFTGVVFAQEWHTTNQITVVWDAVTEMQGGAVIPETDIIEYRVYLANAITDPDKMNPAEIDITGELSYTITLTGEGHYFVGLQTIRKILVGSNGDESVVGESVIGWTDDPAIVLDGHTFGIRHFLPPMVPTGLRPGS